MLPEKVVSWPLNVLKDSGPGLPALQTAHHWSLALQGMLVPTYSTVSKSAVKVLSCLGALPSV